MPTYPPRLPTYRRELAPAAADNEGATAAAPAAAVLPKLKRAPPRVHFDLAPYLPMIPQCSWQLLSTAQSFPTTLPEYACIYQVGR